MVEVEHWVCGFFHDVPQQAAVIACNMIKNLIKSLYRIAFVLRIPANNFLSR